MPTYEYAVIPAPTRGEKAKGAKTPADRYALALTQEINRKAAEGWEYVRAEVLPSEERSGLAGRATVYHNLLVFRRPLAALAEAAAPRQAAAPQPEYPAAARPARAPEKIPDLPAAASPLPAAQQTPADATPPAPREQPDR